jgi:hypothetical protein
MRGTVVWCCLVPGDPTKSENSFTVCGFTKAENSPSLSVFQETQDLNQAWFLSSADRYEMNILYCAKSEDRTEVRGT